LKNLETFYKLKENKARRFIIEDLHINIWELILE